MRRQKAAAIRGDAAMTCEYNWNRLGNCEKDYQPRKLILGIRDAVKNGSVPKLRLFPPA